jgi:hypothetical protein
MRTIDGDEKRRLASGSVVRIGIRAVEQDAVLDRDRM